MQCQAVAIWNKCTLSMIHCMRKSQNCMYFVFGYL